MNHGVKQTSRQPSMAMPESISRLMRASMAILLVIATTFAAFPMVPLVGAVSLQEQIDRLSVENEANDLAVVELSGQAANYQDAIKRLESQISLLQAAITDNQTKQTALQAEIKLKQVELDKQKVALGDIVKSMYVKEQISTVEILATSKSLSDFVDSETYRSSVQNNIQKTLAEISKLQTELGEQKVQVERLLADQRSQAAEQVALKTEQDRLLTLNLGQQDDFNKKTVANQSKIDALISEQARLNDPGTPANYYFLRFSGQVNSFNADDYPFKNAGFSMSTAPGCVDDDGPDPWGYCTRQCVSYAAWAVKQSGRSAPMYYGNAKDWVVAARRQGVAVFTTTPKAGDVAITTAGTWGHAMYVEKVDSDRIYVSQYNAQLKGQYSVQWRSFR